MACFFDDQGQAIGSVVVYVRTHVDDMPAAGDMPIPQLFIDALKIWEITQCRIIGASNEGEVTYTRMWIAVRVWRWFWNSSMSICEC